MRSICRKLLRQLQHNSQHEGQHFRKQTAQTRVVLNRNDVYDLKHYLEASNSVFVCCSGPGKLRLSFAELSALFKPQSTAETQIAAYWASMSSFDSKDAAYGAILGAFVGDAAGGVLEFMSGVTAADVDAALKMPGGGCWELGPGQVRVYCPAAAPTSALSTAVVHTRHQRQPHAAPDMHTCTHVHMHTCTHAQTQITDDSEMAMCLLHGLKETAASGSLPLNAIAQMYIKSLDSPPFDIGGNA
jgi:hypothetical protein